MNVANVRMSIHDLGFQTHRYHAVAIMDGADIVPKCNRFGANTAAARQFTVLVLSVVMRMAAGTITVIAIVKDRS